MINELNNSKTVVKRAAAFYTVDQATDSALYSSIVAGTTLLPENSLVRLITTGDVQTIKFSPDGGTWATAQNVGTSAASLAAITALTPDASPTATDLPTTLVMVNSLKTKVNAIIAALKA